MITRTSICACSSILSAIPTHTSPKTQDSIKTSDQLTSIFQKEKGFQSILLPKSNTNIIFRQSIYQKVYQNALIDRFSEDHISTLKFQECLLDRSRASSLDSIIGHDYAKEQINDIIKFISLPKISMIPHLHSILLYGPPGVGKTQLALSLLGNNDITCLEFSMPVLHSKYIGGFEKNIECLFDYAIKYSPSVIFIDELDSIGRRRVVTDSDTERRMKSEFIKQLDRTENLHSKILIIGITNIPWELDVATIRRFDKKLLLGMPTQEERRRIIQKYSITEEISEGEWGDIMAQTDGYTGSDLKILIADASMVAMKEKNCSKISYNHIMAGLKHCKPSVPRPMQSLFQTFLSKFGDDNQNKFAGERTNGLSYFS